MIEWLPENNLVCSYNETTEIQYERVGMSADAVVRARIDANIKKEASLVLEAMGLTVSDAVRMMLIRVATEKSLPFEPLTPDAKVLTLLRESRKKAAEWFSIQAV